LRLIEAVRKKQCCYADARGDGRLAECTTSLQPVRDWLGMEGSVRRSAGTAAGGDECVCEGGELGLDGVVGGDAEKVQSGGTLLTIHAS
jgi:hypothetical protein